MEKAASLTMWPLPVYSAEQVNDVRLFLLASPSVSNADVPTNPNSANVVFLGCIASEHKQV